MQAIRSAHEPSADFRRPARTFLAASHRASLPFRVILGIVRCEPQVHEGTIPRDL